MGSSYGAQSGNAKPKGDWYERRATSAAIKDALTGPERLGEIVGIAVVILITAYFAYSEVTNTGFFTSAFGTTEAALFYSSLLFGVVTGGTRAIMGRRNKVRPLEAAGGFLWVVTSFWLLMVFPFNFTYLASAMPSSIQFLLSWISNDIGWAILLIGGLGGIFAVVDSTLMYVYVRRYLSTRQEARRAESVSSQ